MPLENPVGRAVYRPLTKTYRQTFKVMVDKVFVTPDWNIRTLFDGIEDLAADIVKNGLLEPLVGDFDEHGNFHIHDGERRFRAIKYNIANGVDIEYVECRPLDSQTPMIDKFIMMMSSGIHKRDYTACEYAEGVQRLKEEYKISNTEISEKLNKSRQWVDMMLKLASAPEDIKEQINAGQISYVAWVNSNRTKKKPQEKEGPVPVEPIVNETNQQPAIGDGVVTEEAEPVSGDKTDESSDKPTAPMLNHGDVIIPAKDPSLIDETAGIITKTGKAQYGDRPLDTQELEGQMLAEDKLDGLDTDKLRDEELEYLFKRVLKNTNWIEKIGNVLSAETAADLDTRLQWIRSDIAEIKLQLKTKLKR